MEQNKPCSERRTRGLVQALRFVTGAVFTFSGFVKAVDPWGVLYKLEDYVGALGWELLTPFLLFGAFAISILEFVLGVCLIVGAYRRVSVWLSFLFMMVMTPLTLWLAVTGAVEDCGCFGEAITLSNTATFVKNVLLLGAVIYLLRNNVRVGNFYSPGIQWMVTVITAAFVTVTAFYGYFYQPMMDFRPYKTGQPIVADTENGSEDEEDAFVFIYEKDGVQKEFKMDEVPAEEDTAWTFVDRRELRSPQERVSDFTLTLDGEDVTADVVKTEGEQIILVFSDMTDIDISYTYLINIIDDFAKKNGVNIIGATGAGRKEVEEWNDLSMADYPIYFADDTQLKMLVRGNPAVVYLRDGTVVWKRTLQSISAARVDAAIGGAGDMEWIAGDYDGERRLKYMAGGYVSLMILILILNRSYRVYKFSARLIKKNRK